jgi:hypothetical protein
LAVLCAFSGCSETARFSVSKMIAAHSLSLKPL